MVGGVSYNSTRGRGRGRGVRRSIQPYTLTPNSPIRTPNSPLRTPSSSTPITPPVTLSGTQSLSPALDALQPTPPASQSPVIPLTTTESQTPNDIDPATYQGSTSQQRGPRGTYLSKNIPQNSSKRKFINIADRSHFLEPVAARTITKSFKSHFRGKQTQWHLLDEDLVEALYKSFQDRFQHDVTVDPQEAREVWEENSKDRCRGTWALVRKKCKDLTNSNSPSDWKAWKPDFVTVEDWDGILESWKTEKWQKQSVAGGENRKKVPGDVDGTSSYVRHTGGSISFSTHLHRWEKLLGK